MKLLIIIILSLVYQNFLEAKTNFLSKISYNLDYISTIESTNISNLTDDYFCCPNSMNGDGSRINLGASYNFGNIFNLQSLDLLIGFSYNNYNSKIKYEEKEVINVNGEPFVGIISHSVDFKSNSLSPIIGFKYSYNSFFLRYHLGVESIINNNFTQKEEIVFPTDRGVFEDTQTRTRKVVNSSLNNFTLPFTNQIIIGYSLMHRSGLVINTGISFGHRSSLSNNFDWTYQFYGFSLELFFK